LLDSLSDVDGFSSMLRQASESNIVGLPSMVIRMVSDIQQDGHAKKILYDFRSKFVRADDTHDFEDIYITLNMSLYQWLTVLRKNLSRELDQALLASEKRGGTASSGPQPSLSTAGIGSINTQTKHARSRSKSQPPSPVSATPAMSPSHSSSSAHPSVPLDPPESSTPFPKPAAETGDVFEPPLSTGLVYVARKRDIERLTMRQLGEATPDVTHPFFMRAAGFNLEDSFPQYVHEYATVPLEQIMEALLKLYSRQLMKNEKEGLRENSG
jgi:hypothetical protein